jgi:hypothetical protein
MFLDAFFCDFTSVNTGDFVINVTKCDFSILYSPHNHAIISLGAKCPVPMNCSVKQHNKFQTNKKRGSIVYTLVTSDNHQCFPAYCPPNTDFMITVTYSYRQLNFFLRGIPLRNAIF